MTRATLVSGPIRANRERTRQVVGSALDAMDRGSGGNRALGEGNAVSQMPGQWSDLSVLRAASPFRLVVSR